MDRSCIGVRLVGWLPLNRWNVGMRKALDEQFDGCCHDGDDGFAGLRPQGHLRSLLLS